MPFDSLYNQTKLKKKHVKRNDLSIDIKPQIKKKTLL